MRRITIAAGFIFVFTSSHAPAGQVFFDPPVYEVHPGNIPPSIEVQVSVSNDAGSFSAIDLVFGSDELSILEFTFDNQYVDSTEFRSDPLPIGIYPSDLYIGAFGTTPIATPSLIGSLTLALPTAAAGYSEGQTFEYGVDWTRDGGFDFVDPPLGSRIGGEPAYGIGYIVITPEPATALLLLFGAGVVLTRRRSKELAR